MHTTDTVDFDVIVSGEVYLELDDGAKVLLRAGDCVIQNRTRHAWHNRSPEKCVISVAIVGAERKPCPSRASD
jgi:quercetin dioxygenase-like cupin family protein